MAGKNFLSILIRRILGADSEVQRVSSSLAKVASREACLREASVLLDMGCRDGSCAQELLQAVKSYNQSRNEPNDSGKMLIGVDINQECLCQALVRFPCVMADLERSAWPFKDDSVPCVILNQILEHLANPFHALSESQRVLKVGGCLVVGIPNLAGLPNRLYLLFGRQPIATSFPGPHVRGFTYSCMKAFLESNHNFSMVSSFGSCFYPFPPPISEWAGRLFPSGSSYVFFILKKTSNQKSNPWKEAVGLTHETVFSR
jgi:SAM-dependent methyltransferase